MAEEKLKSMVEYILEIDWLTTSEFCKKYNYPLPYFTGEVKSSAQQFLDLDAVKHRMFVEYAKFLNKKLNIEMFVGQKAIFPGFELTKDFENKSVVKQIGSEQVYIREQDFKDFEMNYPRGAQRIEDIVSLGLIYLKN